MSISKRRYYTNVTVKKQKAKLVTPLPIEKKQTDKIEYTKQYIVTEKSIRLQTNTVVICCKY